MSWHTNDTTLVFELQFTRVLKILRGQRPSLPKCLARKAITGRKKESFMGIVTPKSLKVVKVVRIVEQVLTVVIGLVEKETKATEYKKWF